MGTYKTKAANI